MVTTHSPLRHGRLWACWLALALPAVAAGPAPLARAHSHNDYEQPRPLFDALEHGFCSIEADIYLVNGELLVAHDLKDVRPGRTLEALYLAPLRERTRTNDGRVFAAFATNPPAWEFTLLVDIKRDVASVYPVLRDLLERYEPMLTVFTPTSTTPRAVTVLLSGDRPFAQAAAEPRRLYALDGRLRDLEANPSVHLYPLISDSWFTTFPGVFSEDWSEATRARVAEFVTRTHAQGRRLRFWATPDRRPFWRALHGAGVDYIGTDNPAGLAAFLNSVAPR